MGSHRHKVKSAPDYGEARVGLSQNLGLALECLWLLAVFAVPLLYAPDLPKMVIFSLVVSMMVSLLLAGAVVQLLRGTEVFGRRTWLRKFQEWSWTREQRWLLAVVGFYVLTVTVSTLFSISPGLSVWGRDAPNNDYGLSITLVFVAFFLVLTMGLRHQHQLGLFVKVFIMSGLLAAFYGLLQLLGLDPLHIPLVGGRIGSTLYNPVFLGQFLAVVLPLTLAYAISRWQHPTPGSGPGLVTSITWGLVLSVLSVALVMTGSRGPWLGLAGGLLVMFLLVWRYWKSLYLKTFLMGLGALGLVAGLSLAAVSTLNSGASSPQPSRDVMALMERVIPGEGTSMETYTSQRSILWAESINAALKRPSLDTAGDRFPLLRHLVGYGPETFRYALSVSATPKYFDHYGATFVRFAHNHLFQIWVEQGILGLLGYGTLFLTLVLIALRRLRQTGSSHAGVPPILVLGFLAALVTQFIQNLFGIVHVTDSLIFWSLAGLLYASTPPLEPRGKAGLERQRQPRRWQIRSGGLALVALAGVVLIGFFAYNLRLLLAERVVVQMSRQTVSSNDLVKVTEQVEKVRQHTQGIHSYQLWEAAVWNAMRQMGDDDRVTFLAKQEYLAAEKATSSRPFCSLSHFVLGEAALILAQHGEPAFLTKASDEFDRAISLAPNLWAFRNKAAQAAILQGDYDRATEQLGRSLEMKSHEPRTYELLGYVYAQRGQVEEAISAYEQAQALDPTSKIAQTNLTRLYQMRNRSSLPRQ